MFDVPLLNARLAQVDERPARIGEKHGVTHVDLMFYSRGQSMRIGSSKLDNVSKFFKGEELKTDLDGETWQLAAAGDTTAMDDVVTHCEADIKVLREVWPKLAPYVKKHQFTLAEVWQFIDKIPSRKNAF